MLFLDALHSFATEIIDQYHCTNTNIVGQASRSWTFESLPPILVLHLKRFGFEGKKGLKLCKQIDMQLSLEINPKLLGEGTRGKASRRHRTYKVLSMCVFHLL